MKIPVYAQHIDPIRGVGPDAGKYTGHVLAYAVKAAGAQGTLLNHSEKNLNPHRTKQTISIAKENGLKIVFCVDSLKLARKIIDPRIDYIAYEPAELIGGKVSVTEAKTSFVEYFAKLVLHYNNKNSTDIHTLIGAGIRTPKDVRMARVLGIDGILVSSVVVQSKDPGVTLDALCDALYNGKI